MIGCATLTSANAADVVAYREAHIDVRTRYQNVIRNS